MLQYEENYLKFDILKTPRAIISLSKNNNLKIKINIYHHALKMASERFKINSHKEFCFLLYETFKEGIIIERLRSTRKNKHFYDGSIFVYNQKLAIVLVLQKNCTNHYRIRTLYDVSASNWLTYANFIDNANVFFDLSDKKVIENQVDSKELYFHDIQQKEFLYNPEWSFEGKEILASSSHNSQINMTEAPISKAIEEQKAQPEIVIYNHKKKAEDKKRKKEEEKLKTEIAKKIKKIEKNKLPLDNLVLEDDDYYPEGMEEVS